MRRVLLLSGMMQSPLPPMICALAVALLALAACGDATRPGPASDRFDFTDPVGDTAAYPGSDTTFRALDANEVSGELTPDSLILTIAFTTPIRPATDSAPNSVVGTIEIDADDDSATGIPAFTESFPNTTHLGVDYYIFIPDSAGTGVDVHNLATGQTTSYPATYGTNSITMRIPLSAIGSSNALRMIGIVGTTQRATDLLPDTGNYALALPVGRRVGDGTTGVSASRRWVAPWRDSTPPATIRLGRWMR